jgi:hypothetical protein
MHKRKVGVMTMKKLTLALIVSLCVGSTQIQAAQESKGKREHANQYTLTQAISDNAQLHTIAFAGLAFLTGDLGYDSFLPPGKVSDYFGFQYMRDIDQASRGHNTWFLTSIASNMLTILNDDQKAQLVALAEKQKDDIERFAKMRFPLMKAFRRNLEGDIPENSQGLDKAAVIKYSSMLYELDGTLAYQRAQVMGNIIHSLNSTQIADLAKLKFGDSATWPDIEEVKLKLPHTLNVAVMTYVSEMYAWYAGSLDADTYFCPERHGMYFGGFGMKTAPAMGKKDYAISTSLTGDSGKAFIELLNNEQREEMTNILALQRDHLDEIINLRRKIATELRQFQTGNTGDSDKVVQWSKRYGELDGEMSYLYATTFAKIAQTLSEQQKEQLTDLRSNDPSVPKGPFLYSTPIEDLQIENTDFLFGLNTK